MTASIAPSITMRELTAQMPGAQRALFRRYHIGGCASCGFRPEETLAEVCARNDGLDVNEVIEQLLASHEADAQTMMAPADAAELVRAGKARLLDVRTREEFDAVRIEGATFFTQELMHELGGLGSRYADHFRRSSRHAQHGRVRLLRRPRLGKCAALRGGIDAWSVEVDPSLPRYELE